MGVVSDPVYLVRHGQSEWNVLRLTQGQTPHPPLTDLGREQAAAAAYRIKADLGGASIARVVSSDLSRAAETAAIVADLIGGEITPDVRLREQDLGDLEGKSYEETWAAAEAHDWSDPALPVAGGESLLDVRARMAAVLEETVDAAGPVVLVSHGDAIRVGLTAVTGVMPHEAEWVDVPNGAVARVDGTTISWLG